MTLTPGQRHYQHHTKPFQTKAANNVLVCGTNWISVTAFRLYLLTFTTFDGIVNPDDERNAELWFVCQLVEELSYHVFVTRRGR